MRMSPRFRVLVALAVVGVGVAGWRAARGPAVDPEAASAGVPAEAFRAASEADRRLLVRAAALVRAGQYESAVQLLNGMQAKDDGPVHLRAVVLTGQSLVGLGHLAEAERVFAYAAEKRPDDPDAHRGLAAVYDELGATAQAELHLSRVTALDPSDYRAAKLLGTRLLEMKEFAAAEAALRTALGRNPPDAEAAEGRRELAAALNGQTRYADALDAIGPGDSPGDRAVRAESLRQLGRLDEARAECDAGLTAAPADTRLLLEHGLTAAARADDPAAAAALEKLVVADPYNHTAWYQLGLAYQRLGRVADAARAGERFKDVEARVARVADLNRQAIARPRDAAVRRELAEACRRIDRPDLGQMWDRAAAACPPTK